MVSVHLVDRANTSRRGRPLGCSGATVVAYVGENPSANPADWIFFGNSTQMRFDLEFPNLEPGTKVWLRSFYRNSTDQSGPASDPVSVYLGSGGVAQSA
jgi:hypothetical protein